MKIFKYELAILEFQKLYIPKGGEILHVQTQYDMPCVWVLVSLENELEERCFSVVGTGQTFGVSDKKYIGTFQTNDGQFVGHLFEIHYGRKP